MEQKPAFVDGRWPKIYWTGIKLNKLYTKKEFLKASRDKIIDRIYYRRRGDPAGFVPEGLVKWNDIDSRIKILGAEWIYPKKVVM